MNIGLYFGSFNPVHIGHLIIANHMLNETALDKVWLVVSPQNPFKTEAALLNEYDRLHLLRLAVEDDTRLRASDIEFQLPKPSYTIHTLTVLEERYPDHKFSLIMGSDSLANLHKWKNADKIMGHYQIYVYLRPGHPVKELPAPRIEVLDAPQLQISATYIRRLAAEGKSLRYLVPEKVQEEIIANRYFRK